MLKMRENMHCHGIAEAKKEQKRKLDENSRLQVISQVGTRRMDRIPVVKWKDIRRNILLT